MKDIWSEAFCISKEYETSGVALRRGFTINSMVEYLSIKQGVIGSNPISFIYNAKTAPVNIENRLNLYSYILENTES